MNKKELDEYMKESDREQHEAFESSIVEKYLSRKGVLMVNVRTLIEIIFRMQKMIYEKEEHLEELFNGSSINLFDDQDYIMFGDLLTALEVPDEYWPMDENGFIDGVSEYELFSRDCFYNIRSEYVHGEIDLNKAVDTLVKSARDLKMERGNV